MKKAELALLDAVMRLRKELDEGFVRLAVHGSALDPDFHPVAVHARELCARGAGLHVQLEDQSAAAAKRRWPTGMSSTWMMTSSTSGLRSKLPMSGITRRSGRRKCRG